MSKEKEQGWNYTGDTGLGMDGALLSPESQAVVRQGKALYQKGFEAGDQKMMDQGHAMAEAERAKYGYSGGANGGGYISLTPTAKEPDYGEASTQYKTAMDRAIQTLQGRGKFTYDPETDPSYQQYKEQYTRLGKQAMEDSYGHAALRTGGLGGSAAMSASQQAYNGYMQALADKIPELRQIAYQMYQDEENGLRRDIDLYGSLDQQEWNRWNSDRDFQRGAFENDRSFDHGKTVDQWNMARQLDRDAKTDEETQYQRSAEKAAALASTGNYSGYAQLWGMSEEETQALVDKYAKEERLTEEQAARDLADWYAGYGDLSKAKALGVTPQMKASGGSGGGKVIPAAPPEDKKKAEDSWADWMGGALQGLVGGAMKTAVGRFRGQGQASGNSYANLVGRIQSIPAGVTPAQMESLVNEIDRALDAGTITQAEYDELGRKLGYQ